MPDANIEILRKKTYVKAIENSVGSRFFNSLFVTHKDTGNVQDALNDGEYSCAFFVSGLLYLMEAVSKTTATVKSLKNLLEKDTKWKQVSIDMLEAGDVVFWEKIKFEDGSENAHVGFVLNKDEAVSTDYVVKAVARHSIKKLDRKVEAVYRYKWPLEVVK